MNIWVISKYASSKETKFESRIFALGRRFAQLGHEVTIISSDSNHFGEYPTYKQVYNDENIDGVNVLRIRTFKYSRTTSIRRIISWIDFEIKLFFAPLRKSARPDILIVSSLSLLTILNGIRLKKHFNTKLVFEIRDIWPLTMVAEAGYNPRNPFVKLLGLIEKIGYKKSDLVVGTMPNLVEHVHGVTGNRNIKVECVPFGFDAFFFKINKPDPISFASRYNIPRDKFIIGYAGSIGLSNGLSALIDCIQNMRDDTRFIFLILGDGEMKKEYAKKTSGCNNVIFIPKVDRSEVSSFLSLCNILYFSALKSQIWKYGWSPNKLIDYMMAGKPIIASYSGFQSMINEANSGIFIESENAFAIKDAVIQFFKLSAEERNKIGINGRNWLLENRDWDVVAEKYIFLLNKVIHER